MLRPSYSRDRCAFTLVEILVVLGILVVLVTLLLPVLSRVKERGRNTTCQSNLRRIGLAVQQYVADYDGIYPPQEYATTTGYRVWIDLLQPYLKSRTIFYCPLQNSGTQNNQNYFYNVYQLNQYRYINGRLRSLTGKLEADLPQPSNLVVSYDSFSDNPVNYEMVKATCGEVPVITLHSGGANFVYADGHVKRLSIAQQQQIGCDLYHHAVEDSPR